jgi:hypothetical protein
MYYIFVFKQTDELIRAVRPKVKKLWEFHAGGKLNMNTML